MARFRPRSTVQPPAVQLAIAEEAFRRAESAGHLSSEFGRRAAQDRVEGFRGEVKAAKARREALARVEVLPAISAAAERASQVTSRSKSGGKLKTPRNGLGPCRRRVLVVPQGARLGQMAGFPSHACGISEDEFPPFQLWLLAGVVRAL